jgi:CRP/FNR family transcriptional regulator, anaerobic regulatory protein
MDSSITELATCGNCRLRRLCIPQSLGWDELVVFDDLVDRMGPLHQGDIVVRQGESVRALYVVKVGACRTVHLNDMGDEQVGGFHFPGEIIGLQVIDSGVWRCTVQVLETSVICEIPLAGLQSMSRELPGLQSRMYGLLSNEIRTQQNLRTWLNKRTARECVASFLLDLASRHNRRQLSPVAFRLPMTRADIGSYLGLAIETVSRTLSGMQEDGLVTVRRRDPGSSCACSNCRST